MGSALAGAGANTALLLRVREGGSERTISSCALSLGEMRTWNFRFYAGRGSGDANVVDVRVRVCVMALVMLFVFVWWV